MPLGYNLRVMKQGSTKKPKRWLLYILKCEDNTLYTGITNDLARRVEQHNAGTASRYTRSRRPVSVVHQEPCRNKSFALKKEYAIKALTRKEKEEYIRKKQASLRRKKKNKTSKTPTTFLFAK